MPTTFDTLTPPPWWKQFWPWFLISIPGSTIIAAIITINIAISTDDGLVSQDYYKDGLAIHKQADAVQLARTLGIQTDLRFASETQLVTAQVNSTSNNAIGRLNLILKHPTRADSDLFLSLQPVGPDLYQAELPALISAHWNVQLSAVDAGWELRGRIDLNESEHLLLR